MKIVKSVVNTYLLSHMLWNAKHRLCKHVDTSKDIEKKRKQKTHATHFFFMVDICRYDEQNKLETKKRHAADLSLRRGASHLDKLPAFSFGSGASLRDVSNAAVSPAFDGSLSEFLQFRLYSLFGPVLLKKKSRKTQGEKMYRCCLVHNAKYCKCCQISKLSPALNSPLPSVFSRPCISLISHLIQISFDLLHQIIISLLYPPSFRMLPGPLLFHHPHLHPLPLLPRPSSGCFGYMVKGC